MSLHYKIDNDDAQYKIFRAYFLLLEVENIFCISTFYKYKHM